MHKEYKVFSSEKGDEVTLKSLVSIPLDKLSDKLLQEMTEEINRSEIIRYKVKVDTLKKEITALDKKVKGLIDENDILSNKILEQTVWFDPSDNSRSINIQITNDTWETYDWKDADGLFKEEVADTLREYLSLIDRKQAGNNAIEAFTSARGSQFRAIAEMHVKITLSGEHKVVEVK